MVHAVAGALTRAHLDGKVIDASHRDYERLRRVYNAVIERRPAAIVQAATASDVQKVVTIAAGTGLPLAVRCGGHSFAGLGTCPRGGPDRCALDVDEAVAVRQANTSGERS